MPTAGVNKSVAFKVESAYGTAPTASSANLLRRVTSTVNTQKDTYQSNEIRTDYQVADFRHGVRRVAGQIAGELSPGAYSRFIEWGLKKDFVAGVSAASVALTIAGTGPTYTVTRGTGSYLTDGFKVGDIVRLTVGTLNAANISKNLLITDIGSATVITVLPLNGVAMVAEGPVSGCTVAVQGKKTFIPTSSHTDKSFSIEHWHSDGPFSELYTGCKVSKLAIQLPPTGLATITTDIMGQGITTSTSQYFTSPTALPTAGIFASVNGIVRIGGTTMTSLTGLSFEVTPAMTGDPVVGSNTIPFLYPGRVQVQGQFSAYFDSATLRDAFLNETEIDLICAFSSDNTATSKAMSFAFPRIKVGSADKDDGDKAIVQTFNFTALLNSSGGSGTKSEASTIVIQDTDA